MPEPGPLVVVLGHLERVEADRLAELEAAQAGATRRYIGRGWAMPDSYAPDGVWLHAYATERQSLLESALAAAQPPAEGDISKGVIDV
jgi:hypothetical protein